MKPPKIGHLRHRVVLEQPTRTSDGGGGANIVWVTVAELWADVRPLSGREVDIAEAISGRISHIVTLRNRAGVVPAMRVRLGARLLHITAVIDIDERRRFLKCYCLEQDL